MAAVRLEQPMFELMPYDGVVGLGLGGLSAEANSDFVGQLLRQGKLRVPQIGALEGDGDGGWG